MPTSTPRGRGLGAGITESGMLSQITMALRKMRARICRAVAPPVPKAGPVAAARRPAGVTVTFEPARRHDC